MKRPKPKPVVPVWRVQALRAPLRHAFRSVPEPDTALTPEQRRLLAKIRAGAGRT